MFSCELCGRSMKSRGKNVTIEGAEMLVCPQCAAKYAPSSSQPSARKASAPRTQHSWMKQSSSSSPRSTSPPRRASVQPKTRKRSTRRGQVTLDDMMLIEDYARVIRNARQKEKMSQEELAQKVGERISTLQAIEAGRIKPTRKTIRGLERELGISLLEPVGPVPIKPSKGTRSSSPTLGDRVVIKRKKSQKSE